MGVPPSPSSGEVHFQFETTWSLPVLVMPVSDGSPVYAPHFPNEPLDESLLNPRCLPLAFPSEPSVNFHSGPDAEHRRRCSINRLQGPAPPGNNHFARSAQIAESGDRRLPHKP